MKDLRTMQKARFPGAFDTTMWRGRRYQDGLLIIFAVLLCTQPTIYGRVLHQYGGNTADQLVSDGSDAPISQARLL